MCVPKISTLYVSTSEKAKERHPFMEGDSPVAHTIKEKKWSKQKWAQVSECHLTFRVHSLNQSRAGCLKNKIWKGTHLYTETWENTSLSQTNKNYIKTLGKMKRKWLKVIDFILQLETVEIQLTTSRWKVRHWSKLAAFATAVGLSL